MILFMILLCMLTGLMVINLFEKELRLTKALLIILPVGVVFHTALFTICIFFKIYYGIIPFIVISLLTLTSLIKNRIKIINDIRNIPIYYLVFLILIGIKLIAFGVTGFFEFYNYDEFTAYTRGSIALFSAHDFFSFYETYAPINYFLGTEVLEFSGYTISIARLFSSIYFLLTSYFIFYALQEHRVNKNIASLIAILFVFSSTELIQLSKSFYTNIFFMFYFCISIYSIVNYYFYDDKKGIPWIYYILLLGTFLTRHDAMYFVIIFTVIISCINLFKKKISKMEGISLGFLPILFLPLYKALEKSYQFNFMLSHPENPPLVESVLERLKPENLNQFLGNVWNQTFEFGYYYFNWLIFTIFIIALILTIIYLFKKNASKQYKKLFFWVLFFQLGYVALIITTEFVMFTVNEYRLAASFSRYVLAVLPLSFVVIGIMLYKNTKREKPAVKSPISCSNPKCILIIPAYNEEKNILEAYKRIQEYNKKHSLKLDAIVINDCSTDNTEKVLCDNKIPHIKLIHNLGIGGGVQTGYKYAYDNGYDIAIQYDGDGQHDINYIDKLIKPIYTGKASFTIGSRFIEAEQEGFKSTFFRRIGIRIISVATKLASGKKIYDTTSGYRACNREIMEYFAKNYPIEYPEPITNVELLNMNYIVKEVPVVMKERKEGMSSIRAWKQAYYMINVVLSIIIVGMRGEK